MRSALAVPSISFDLPAIRRGGEQERDEQESGDQDGVRGPPPIAQRALGASHAATAPRSLGPRPLLGHTPTPRSHAP